MISLSVVHWLLAERGWTFEPGPGVIPDPISARRCCANSIPGAARLHRARHRAGAVGQEDGHDRQQRIVRNHPHVQQRLRRGRRAPATFIRRPAREIDALNAPLYATVNNGVYRAGFATTRTPTTRRDARCSTRSTGWTSGSRASRFLCGDADRSRLAAVHHADPLRRRLCRPLQMQPPAHRRLSEPAALSARALPDAGDCRDRRPLPIKRHYYDSHRHINPTGIVPIGPELTL